eukprot:4744973-Pyramimonas_sp.AAC.1
MCARWRSRWYLVTWSGGKRRARRGVASSLTGVRARRRGRRARVRGVARCGAERRSAVRSR